MRNMIRTALIVGTLATPMISMADPAKKEPAPKTEPAKKEDAKAGEAKKDEAAPKADAHKDEKAKKDVKAPATK